MTAVFGPRHYDRCVFRGVGAYPEAPSRECLNFLWQRWSATARARSVQWDTCQAFLRSQKVGTSTLTAPECQLRSPSRLCPGQRDLNLAIEGHDRHQFSILRHLFRDPGAHFDLCRRLPSRLLVPAKTVSARLRPEDLLDEPPT
jgi:hypothetical protein